MYAVLQIKSSILKVKEFLDTYLHFYVSIKSM